MAWQSKQRYLIPFGAAGVGWLLAMATLSRLGPAGRYPAFFAFFYGLGFIFMTLLVRTCPRRWTFRQIAFAACLIGILGRVGFLNFPVSNDVFRYVWEGYIQNQGVNPYQFAPDDPHLAGLRDGPMAAIWPSINHKNLSAAYPPLTMLLFRLLAWMSPGTGSFKMAMMGADLFLLAILVGMVRSNRTPPAHLFWYAANPLVLVYAAGEGHIDIVQAALLAAGLYAIGKKRTALGFLSLGAAAVSKYFACVALPFVMKAANRKAWASAALIVTIVVLPFIDDPFSLFRSLFVFGRQMHYNDGLGEVFRFCFGKAALPMLVLLVLGFLTIVYLIEHDDLRSVYLALGIVLLCLPTLHPWYLLLMAPMMVIYPSRAWLYLMLATIATLPVLAVEYETGVFQEIQWLKWVEYGPFYALLIHDTLVRRPYFASENFPEARRVSVIMPVLNEEGRIRDAIESTRSEPEIVDIIVVDGGSQDRTRHMARKAGARVISSPRGRGQQVCAGIPLATGDVILVLHADTLLTPGAARRMLAELRRHPHIAGGAFEMAFADKLPGLGVVAWLNNVRARWFGIAFGDQGQFFRRAALAKMGGFPDMMLMEDVELSLRLKSFGRPLFIRPGVRVAMRRWVRRGLVGNTATVLKLFITYLVERRLRGANGIRSDYYRKYYGGIQ